MATFRDNPYGAFNFLVTLGEMEHALISAFHHIAVDGASVDGASVAGASVAADAVVAVVESSSSPHAARTSEPAKSTAASLRYFVMYPPRVLIYAIRVRMKP